MKWWPKTLAEYIDFIGDWCARCHQWKSFRLGERFVYSCPENYHNVFSGQVPDAWIIAEDGRPCCLAFESDYGEGK